MKAVHLVKRAYSSFLNIPLQGHEFEHVERILNVDEFELWWSMQPRDQRHSIEVLSRFFDQVPYIKRSEQAAALLHDVGKVKSNLNWYLRVVATLVGPRGRRFKEYHQHEAIGAEMLSSVSEPRTVELVAGTASDVVGQALQAADNI